MQTRLIEEPDDRQVLTPYRDTDCRTAVTRGLAEYFQQLSVEVPGGRLIKLDGVLDTAAEPEDSATYPRAVVYMPADGTYDATGLTPGISADSQVAPGLYVAQPAEYTAELVVEVWATETEDRVALQIMLEDATTPVHWMSGFRLELPHYFAARADYLLLRAQFDETENNTSQRYRLGKLTIKATVPQLRVFRLPLARPRTQVVVSEVPMPEPAATVGRVETTVTD